jgi:hypothetical protein
MLAAHRTFKMDTRGPSETYLLVTTFVAHEGFWKLQRVGSLDESRCIIQMTNNRCVKDKINHVDWSIDLPVRGIAARGEKQSDWFEKNSRPARNQDSVYAVLQKSTDR